MPYFLTRLSQFGLLQISVTQPLFYTTALKVNRNKYKTSVAIINKTGVDTVGHRQYIPSFSVMSG